MEEEGRQAGRVRRYGRSCSRSRVTRHHALTAGACLLQPFSVVSASLLPLIPPRLRARPERSTLASASLSGRPRASFGSSVALDHERWGRGIEPRANHPLYSLPARVFADLPYTLSPTSLSLSLSPDITHRFLKKSNHPDFTQKRNRSGYFFFSFSSSSSTPLSRCGHCKSW